MESGVRRDGRERGEGTFIRLSWEFRFQTQGKGEREKTVENGEDARSESWRLYPLFFDPLTIEFSESTVVGVILAILSTLHTREGRDMGLFSASHRWGMGSLFSSRSFLLIDPFPSSPFFRSLPEILLLLIINQTSFCALQLGVLPLSTQETSEKKGNKTGFASGAIVLELSVNVFHVPLERGSIHLSHGEENVEQ